MTAHNTNHHPMNNQIQQLSEQAHTLALSIYEKRLETENASNVFFYKIKDTKFAELIVRECAEMVRIQNEQFMENESHYGIVSTDVLKHFGFEV
jgi:hypothetical protein